MLNRGAEGEPAYLPFGDFSASGRTLYFFSKNRTVFFNFYNFEKLFCKNGLRAFSQGKNPLHHR